MKALMRNARIGAKNTYCSVINVPSLGLTERLTETPADTLINRYIGTDRLTNQTTDRLTDHPTDQPAYHPFSTRCAAQSHVTLEVHHKIDRSQASSRLMDFKQ